MFERIAHALIAAVVLLGLAACGSDGDRAMTPLQGTAIGIRTAWIDKSVDPGNDFFLYANGAWINSAEIPAGRSFVNATSQAQDSTRQRLADIVEQIAGERQQPGSPGARIAAFRSAYLNQNAIDRAGLDPIRRDLRRFAAIEGREDLSRALGSQLRADVDPLNRTDLHTENLFGLFVTRAPTGDEVMPHLLQGGLGLPGREYYLSPEPEMASLRRAYRGYVARVFRLIGFDDPRGRSRAVVELETAIAEAHVPSEVGADPTRGATIWTREDLARNAPGIDWNAFLAAAGLADQQRFSAYHAGAIVRLARIVETAPLQAWKDWLALHQVGRNADTLPSPIEDAHFALFERRLQGAEQRGPREERVVGAIARLYPDALGQIYVQRYFPDEQRRDVQIMAQNVRGAVAAQLRDAEWLTSETRRAALNKVEEMEIAVGYPDTFALEGPAKAPITSAYDMAVAAERARYRRSLEKLNGKADRKEWWVAPFMPGVLDLPVQNALNVPAGILQPPFYDPAADAASNYGAIGAVIGREIMDSLIGRGAYFDADGILRDWWTEADRTQFVQRAEPLSEQFSRYRPSPDAALDGRSMLAQNAADLAGLRAAYNAYRASLRGKEPPVIEGFTGDQRFFIAYAQSQAVKMREPARGRVVPETQAPGPYRALAVRNLDPWYRAFDVSEGDDVYLPPEERARIW